MVNIKLDDASTAFVSSFDWSEFFRKPLVIEATAAPYEEPADDVAPDDTVIDDMTDDQIAALVALDQWGTAGADRFRFDGKSEPMIFNFGAGDVVELDLGLAAGPLDPGAVAYGYAADDADDRIIIRVNTLFFDENGDAPGGEIKLGYVMSTDGTTAKDFLTAADFVLV